MRGSEESATDFDDLHRQWEFRGKEKERVKSRFDDERYSGGGCGEGGAMSEGRVDWMEEPTLQWYRFQCFLLDAVG